MKVIIILFLASFFSVIGQNATPKVERLITDYRGVAYNGNMTLCYGDYGIITRTSDYGKTWAQISIGDNYSIRRILNVGSQFVGVSDNSLLISNDNGKTWNVKKITGEMIKDIIWSNDGGYILTSNSVLKINSDYSIAQDQVTTFGNDIDCKEIVVQNAYLWVIANADKLLRYNLNSHKLDTLQPIGQVNIPENNYRYPRTLQNLQLVGNTLFVDVCDNFDGGDAERIIQSDDNGLKWSLVFPSKRAIGSSSCHFIKSGKRYFIRKYGINIPNERESAFSVKYFIVDSTHYDNDSIGMIVLNNYDSVKYQLGADMTTPSIFREIRALTSDTIIAVGLNKCIIMSYDDGKSWDLRSYFKYISDQPNIMFRNKDTMYVNKYSTFFRTFDGDATWMPQNYTKSFDENKAWYIFNSLNVSKDTIFLICISNKSSDSNIFISSDAGVTFSRYLSDTLFYNYTLSAKNWTRFGNKYGNILSDPELPPTNHPRKLLLSDKNLRSSETFNLSIRNLIGQTVVDDTAIVVAGMIVSGENKPDSNGNAPSFYYEYLLLRSDDYGKTWDSVRLPIRMMLKHNELKDFYYYADPVVPELTAIGSQIIMPTLKNIAYRYDYATKVFDSIFVGAPQITSCRIGNELCFATAGHSLYYSRNYLQGVPVWDSLTVKEMFADWADYDPEFPPVNLTKIFSLYSSDDTTVVMLLGKKSDSGFLPYDVFQTNIAKVTFSSSLLGAQQSQAEESPAWIWHNAPYPIPAHENIRCKIYWDPKYDISETKIKIINVMGETLSGSPAILTPLDKYSGYVEWHCEGAPSGVYIISVTLRGQTLNIPVLIM